MFKHSAKGALLSTSGATIGIKRFKVEGSRKRVKSFEDVFSTTSLQESALKTRVKTEFLNTWKELCKGSITDVNPTRKVCSLKVDFEMIEMLNKIVGDFILT